MAWSSKADLVLGNLGLVNAVDDGERLWLVDASQARLRSVAHDFAEAVLERVGRSVGDGRGHGKPLAPGR